MTTREKVESAMKRLYRAMFLFMGVCFIGIHYSSIVPVIGGLVGAIGSAWIFSAQMKCPMCKTPLNLYSRREIHVNYCPGCARSIDLEESGA